MPLVYIYPVNIVKRQKIRLLRSIVFPIATYGSECWAMKKSDRARIQSFELSAYRRLLTISWMDERSNKSVLNEIGETKGLVNELETSIHGTHYETQMHGK